MRDLPPLNALRAFEAAARHMSFQRAAEELDVTPTAISHQVKRLEENLGIPLFIRRRPRPLLLTEAGQHLYPVLREGFDTFAAALANLKQEQSITELTVTLINDFAFKWLIPRLPKFQAAHPDIDIRLRTSVVVVDLNARTVDMAIRYGRGNYPDLVSKELFSDAFIPVCSPQLMQSKPLKEPRDLANHTLLHCEWVNYSGTDQPSWQKWLDLAGLTTVDATRGLKFTGETLAIQAAINCQGVALCSNIHAADDLTSGLLVQPFNIELDGFSFYAVHQHDHPKKTQIEHFVSWLESMSRT
ncbi:MAG: transcriptional regulator GcvA [Cyanobacteria bacterium J06642_2]